MWSIRNWIQKLWNQKPQVALAFGHQAFSLVYVDDHQKTHCILIPKQGGELDVLSQVLEKKGLKKKSCVCLLEPHQYQTFLLEKPNVPNHELKEAIRWRVAELIDYPIQEACLDYLELPCKVGLDTSMIYIVVSKVMDVQRALDTATAVGLKPKTIEIPETALRYYIHQNQKSRVSKVLVVFYEQYTYLIITKHLDLLLMRRLECSYQEILTNSTCMAQTLALEIQRSLDYCSAHFTDASHAQVYIDVLGLPKSFQAELSTVLGMPVVSLEAQQSSGMEYHNHNALFLHYAAMGALGRHV